MRIFDGSEYLQQGHNQHNNARQVTHSASLCKRRGHAMPAHNAVCQHDASWACFLPCARLVQSTLDR